MHGAFIRLVSKGLIASSLIASVVVSQTETKTTTWEPFAVIDEGGEPSSLPQIITTNTIDTPASSPLGVVDALQACLEARLGSDAVEKLDVHTLIPGSQRRLVSRSGNMICMYVRIIIVCV